MVLGLLGCLLLADPPEFVASADGDLGEAVAVGVGVWDVCVAYENGNRCNGSAELPSGHTYMQVNGGLTGYCGVTDEAEVVCWGDVSADGL